MEPRLLRPVLHFRLFATGLPRELAGLVEWAGVWGAGCGLVFPLHFSRGPEEGLGLR